MAVKGLNSFIPNKITIRVFANPFVLLSSKKIPQDSALEMGLASEILKWRGLLNRKCSRKIDMTPVTCTVLVLLKLTTFAVALRLRCGSCKLLF